MYPTLPLSTVPRVPPRPPGVLCCISPAPMINNCSSRLSCRPSPTISLLAHAVSEVLLALPHSSPAVTDCVSVRWNYRAVSHHTHPSLVYSQLFLSVTVRSPCVLCEDRERQALQRKWHMVKSFSRAGSMNEQRAHSLVWVGIAGQRVCQQECIYTSIPVYTPCRIESRLASTI